VLKGSSGLATLALCALCVAPAAAKPRERPLGAGNPALPGLAVVPRDRSAHRADRPRLRFSNDSIVHEDGSPGSRRSIVGSWPVMGPVAAEVGLFSVTGAKTGERELKRTDPIADVQPRSSRVAAVGLRMRF
jgi:hypothetical protein